MRNRIPALDISLVCLQHPVTLVSIALLLINDHILKFYDPSWITGKLSDFAGLFFFPFIVAAGLGLILHKSNFTHRRIGQIAFSIVAVWFTLVKLLPIANDLTSRVASWVIGTPVQFILDPTDLFALLAILPAWELWQLSDQMKPTKISYAILSLGILASIATSPPAQAPWVVTTVTNLEYYKDGIVFAGDIEGLGNNYYPVAVSEDGGITWKMPEEYISNIEEKGRPIKHCGHVNEDICYQLKMNGTFQESDNNGEKWTIVKFGEDIYPKDMILFDWEGKEVIIVAVGKTGIMRRELPNGEWIKTPVLEANQ